MGKVAPRVQRIAARPDYKGLKKGCPLARVICSVKVLRLRPTLQLIAVQGLMQKQAFVVIATAMSMSNVSPTAFHWISTTRVLSESLLITASRTTFPLCALLCLLSSAFSSVRFVLELPRFPRGKGRQKVERISSFCFVALHAIGLRYGNVIVARTEKPLPGSSRAMQLVRQ